ncbi:MAG: metallophosphoesterase, partial [Polyangiaceae bacterium]
QSFTTVPATGKITIGLSGDSRDSAEIFQLVQGRMRDAGVSAQLFSGDLVLFGTQEDVYAQWLDKAWKDPMDPTKFLTLGQQLILAVPGNHENSSAQFYGNFALPGDGAFAESFSSVNLGSAHIVLLDDQAIAVSSTGEAAMAQLAWLEDDLTRAEANRKDQPFIVVMHHRGELSTSEHAPDTDVAKMRTALMPVWDKHHVDLVLNGHDHNYERSKPVTGPANAPVVAASATAGTTYVVCAGAGANGYAPGTGTVAYREKNVGFGMGTMYVGVYSVFTLDGGTLTFNAYGLKSAGGSMMGDDVIDTFTLTR